jgi:hypothetical protein
MPTTTHNRLSRTIPHRKPNGELYLFVYDDSTKPELLRTLARWASDPGMSFDWNDAAVVSQRMREPNQC